MRVITTTCTDCGTVVAANELESERVMQCPGLNCERIRRFTDLPEDERTHLLENRDRYRM